LSLRTRRTTNEEAYQIIRGMKKIVRLSVGSSHDLFGPNNTMKLLRPHFPTLTELDLGNNNIMTSAIAQEILSSCSSLVQFRVSRIEAMDIVEGHPWVCLRIQYLSAGIHLAPSTIKILQPLIFDQLSKLTRLRVLGVGHASEINFQEAMDLRLKSGLGKLSSLRLLLCISFTYTKQLMAGQDIDWMLEHWKDLVRIHGELNTYNPDINSALMHRLARYGIRVCPMAKQFRIDDHEFNLL
ncbi:hypothetical protein BGZ65_005260, partial [Modicella reniformis]